MRPIERVLTLWQLGFLSTERVIAWADNEILRHPEPPQEAIDLSLDGPESCLKRAEFEFSARPAVLTYRQEFSLRAVLMSLTSDSEVLGFAAWMSRSAMGEDLDLPEVALAYQVDHLLNDCNEIRAAVDMIRKEMPALLPLCAVNAAPFLEQMPNPSIERGVQGLSPWDAPHVKR